jgi:ferredoxin
MTQIIVLPHVELCPDGAAIEAKVGESICQVLLDNEIDIDHACDQACACTTCHVIVAKPIWWWRFQNTVLIWQKKAIARVDGKTTKKALAGAKAFFYVAMYLLH